MNDDAGRAANQILMKFVTDDGARIEYGIQARRRMQADIAAGVSPTGYRVEWIQETVAGVFEYLSRAAAEFNAAHPQDCISNYDLADVLATAGHALAVKSRESD